MLYRKKIKLTHFQSHTDVFFNGQKSAVMENRVFLTSKMLFAFATIVSRTHVLNFKCKLGRADIEIQYINASAI